MDHFHSQLDEISFVTDDYETAQPINYMRDFVDMHLIFRHRFFLLAEDVGSGGDCAETIQRMKAGGVAEVLYFQVVI